MSEPSLWDVMAVDPSVPIDQETLLLIICDQRRRSHLDHHQSRFKTRVSGQKCRQILIQGRIHQTIDTPFRNSGQCGERDGKIIQCQRQRLPVKISTGDDFVADHQRIIGHRIQLDFENPPRFVDRIADRAMHLRSAAQ